MSTSHANIVIKLSKFQILDQQMAYLCPKRLLATIEITKYLIFFILGGQFIGGCNDGPRSVTLPAVKALSKGFSIFGFGDTSEAREASDERFVETKGGVISLNNEGLLQSLLRDVRVKFSIPYN